MEILSILKKRYHCVAFVFLFLILLFLSIYIHYPISPTQDPALHAEMTILVGQQGYLHTWEPYAENSFTYPPLFHYMSYFITLFGLSPIDAVRILGILIFLTIPISIYFLAKEFFDKDRKRALVSAFSIAMLPLIGFIFIIGEFPELLALELIILSLYFMKRGNNKLVALLTGLTVLAHPLMAIIAVIIFFYNLKNIINKPKNIFLYVAIFLIVTSLWMVKYFEISQNMVSIQWENAFLNQPFFWFWPAGEIVNFLFGTGLAFIIFPLSLIGFLKAKDKFLKAFFLITFAFTMFHLPYTQTKVYDLFSIPVIILAVFGVFEISRYLKERYESDTLKKIPIIIFVCFLLLFQVSHFVFIKNTRVNENEIPTDSLISASVWLGEYDTGFVRIYSQQAPVWVGILSNKKPLEPWISCLETFSDDYVDQVESRGLIESYMESGNETGLAEILEGRDVRYIITKVEADADMVFLDKIYDNEGWYVYKNIF